MNFYSYFRIGGTPAGNTLRDIADNIESEFEKLNERIAELEKENEQLQETNEQLQETIAKLTEVS